MKLRHVILTPAQIEEMQGSIAPLADLLKTYSLISIRAGMISENPVAHLRNCLCILEKIAGPHTCENCRDTHQEIMQKIRAHLDSMEQAQWLKKKDRLN